MANQYEGEPALRQSNFRNETVHRLYLSRKLGHTSGSLPDPEDNIGQNFITDSRLILKIAKLIDQDSPVIEIGSGHGILTEELAKDAPWLIGIELDPDFFNPVLSSIQDRYPQALFIQGDALKVDLPRLCDTSGKTQIVSNLPFYIAPQFMAKLIGVPIRNAVFFLGDAIAQEVKAPEDNPQYGHASLIAQTFFHTETKFEVGDGCFYPKPDTTGEVVVMTPIPLDEIPKDTGTQVLSRIIRDTQQDGQLVVATSIFNALEQIENTPSGEIRRESQQSINTLLKIRRRIRETEGIEASFSILDNTFFMLNKKEVRVLVRSVHYVLS